MSEEIVKPKPKKKRKYHTKHTPGPKPKKWNAKAKARQKRYLKRKEEREMPPHIKEMRDQLRIIDRDIQKARKKIAVKAILVTDKKMGGIAKKEAEEITLPEAKYSLEVLNSTEFSGKKAEEPKTVVNIMDGATANIQQNMAEIYEILDRSNIDIDEVLRKAGEKMASEPG